MKQEVIHTKALSTLLKRLKNSTKPQSQPPRDPVLQMVVGFLSWETTVEAAEDALGKLLAVMVDINELRVTYDDEIIAVIGWYVISTYTNNLAQTEIDAIFSPDRKDRSG